MSRMKPEGIEAKNLQLGHQYDIKMGDKNIGRFAPMKRSKRMILSSYIYLNKVEGGELKKSLWLGSKGNVVTDTSEEGYPLSYGEFNSTYTAKKA